MGLYLFLLKVVFPTLELLQRLASGSTLRIHNRQSQDVCSPGTEGVQVVETFSIMEELLYETDCGEK